MTPLSLFLTFAAKHWKLIAISAAAIAVFIGFQIVQSKLDRAHVALVQTQTQLVVSNKSIGALQSAVQDQNAMITVTAQDGERRQREGQATLVAEVRAGAKAGTVARELARNPQAGGDQGRTSATVMAAREYL